MKKPHAYEVEWHQLTRAFHSKCLEAENGLQSHEGSLMHDLASTAVLVVRPPGLLLQHTFCKKGIAIRKDVGMRSWVACAD